jgi:SAM-dependent methyltransferase
MSVVSQGVLKEHYLSQTRQDILAEEEIWDDGTLSGAYRTVSRDAQFIDFGCGYGRFIPAYNGLGFARDNYLGIDFITSQVELARECFPGYTFEECSLYDVGERHSGKFDAFACICVLMYVPDDLMLRALRSMRASLRPGAVGFVSTPAGEGLMEATFGHMLNTFRMPRLHAWCVEAGFSPNLYERWGMIHGTLTAD